MTRFPKVGLAFAVAGLPLLAAAPWLAAEPAMTTLANVAVPAATRDAEEPGTSPDPRVCVPPVADTVVRSTGANHGGKKWLAIGSWVSKGSTGTGDGGCTMHVVEQALNTSDTIGQSVLSGEYSCSPSSFSERSIADVVHNQWSFLKFDTGGAAHVSSARLRLYGARSSKSHVDLWADVLSASHESWKETRLNGRLESGDLLDRVKLAKDKTKRWYEWDVSEWVLRERAAGRHVVTLALQGNDLAVFHSRESKTNPPELVLVP